MRHAVIFLLFVLSTAAAQDVVPVYEEPFHRLVADTRNFKALNILIPPGGTTLYHTHAEPTFYVTLQRTMVRSQRLGGEWGVPSLGDWAPGDVSHDDDARANPFTHRVNNTSGEGFRLILITNDRREPHAPGQDVLASLPGQPGVDSQYFSQSRIDLGPGEQLDWDGVDHPLVLVLATETHVVVRSSTEQPFVWGMLQAGDVQSIDGDGGFRFENRSREPATIIVVAIR